jgi:hypothetical protein
MAASLHSASRRSVATIASTALRAPARQTIAATSALQRGALSAANRGLSSTSQSRRSLVPCQSRSHIAPSLRQQVRWNSHEPSSVFREWGFEDVSQGVTITVTHIHIQTTIYIYIYLPNLQHNILANEHLHNNSDQRLPPIINPLPLPHPRNPNRRP